VNFTGGLILLAVAVALLFFGKARGGEIVPFLRGHWIVSQAYAMATLLILVVGMTVTIMSWP
jgi:hypothetical protein